MDVQCEGESASCGRYKRIRLTSIDPRSCPTLDENGKSRACHNPDAIVICPCRPAWTDSHRGRPSPWRVFRPLGSLSNCRQLVSRCCYCSYCRRCCSPGGCGDRIRRVFLIAPVGLAAAVVAVEVVVALDDAQIGFEVGTS